MDILIELTNIDRSKLSKPNVNSDVLTTVTDEIAYALKSRKVRTKYSKFSYNNTLQVHCNVPPKCNFDKVIATMEKIFSSNVSIYKTGISRRTKYYYLYKTNF